MIRTANAAAVIAVSRALKDGNGAAFADLACKEIVDAILVGVEVFAE
jgi:hypothetical protein